MTKRDLLLQALRDAGRDGVTTSQLLHVGVGSRYGARLRELREMGYVVQSTRIRDGAWRYQLTWDVERGRALGETPVGGGTEGTPRSAAGSSDETPVSPRATLFDPEPQPGNAILGEAA